MNVEPVKFNRLRLYFTLESSSIYRITVAEKTGRTCGVACNVATAPNIPPTLPMFQTKGNSQPICGAHHGTLGHCAECAGFHDPVHSLDGVAEPFLLPPKFGSGNSWISCLARDARMISWRAKRVYGEAEMERNDSTLLAISLQQNLHGLQESNVTRNSSQTSPPPLTEHNLSSSQSTWLEFIYKEQLPFSPPAPRKDLLNVSASFEDQAVPSLFPFFFILSAH